jgi:hypothetical protein
MKKETTEANIVTNATSRTESVFMSGPLTTLYATKNTDTVTNTDNDDTASKLIMIFMVPAVCGAILHL